MIINGGSRGSARGYVPWLGNHLTRTDTNERIEVLELQSAHDGQQPERERLTETFRDWQALCAATNGTAGLYHANIDPAKDYAMTREQWQRAVDVLEKELGLEGQPRAVVLHEKEGRAHIHVVWARTDISTMKLRSDSHNYAAHERASQQLEREFGHEPVPGKHAKRDRDRQPEPPKAEYTHAEWQQAERAHLKPGEHKARIAALQAGSDSGQAFRAALDDAGYVLARGDGRDFVAIDDVGKVHSVGRALRPMKAPELRAFMADIDRDSLPSVEEGRALQADRQKEQAAPSKEPQPGQGKAAETPAPAEDALSRAELRKMERALTERHAFEAAEIRQRQQGELRQLRKVLRDEVRKRIDDIRAMQQAERDRWWRLDKEQRSGIWGFINAVQSRLNPVAAAEKAKAREKAVADMAARQKKERADLIALQRQTRDLEIEGLKDRHEQQRREHGARYDDELARYTREHEAARELMRQMEEAQRQREEERQAGESPGRDPPRAR